MAATIDLTRETFANHVHNEADLIALRGFVGRPLGIMPRRIKGTPAMYKAMVDVGLEAVTTVNDGNCFFAAISDQLHGNASHTKEYRALTIEYMQNNKELYLPYISVKRGGGTREVAKRKNAGGYSVSVDHGPASQDARDLQWNNHIKHMAKSGTYVEQTEIFAMAAALQINIRIFEPCLTHDTDETPNNGKTIAAVAYDPIAQHYSSVRRVGASRTGPASIGGPAFQAPIKASDDSPSSPSRPSADYLSPESFARSRSSTPGSVSIQRDDDDTPQNPPKRAASGRKIRAPTSRKPSKLSKRVPVTTPSTQTSRGPSPDAVSGHGDASDGPKQDLLPEKASASEEPAAAVTPLVTVAGKESLPSPPESHSSPSPVVIVSSDDDEAPLSPRKIAQRRRSSRRSSRAAEAESDAGKSSSGDAGLKVGGNAKAGGARRRRLCRGLRGGRGGSKTGEGEEN